MARQVLDHGVIIPAEYSDDWYEDMSTNLNKLDEVIGSDADKLSEADVSEVALSGDYDDLTDKPDLKPVATSGDYDDLDNKPALKPVATSGDYDDLTNKPSYGILRMTSETLSDSGSGAISNLNSDSKLAAGDYVLDAALKVFLITAVSAPNYTVGTSLFQITNASALAAVATSGSYDDLNNLPAYGITRFVNAAITDNSNVAFANISSVDKIKAGDFLLDNAGKMYLIASVDSINETAAVTTPLTQLAVDSSVMHLSGNETASGEKTFVNPCYFNGANTRFIRTNNDGVVVFGNGLFEKGQASNINLGREYHGTGTGIIDSISYLGTSLTDNGNVSQVLLSVINNTAGSTSRTELNIKYDKSDARPRKIELGGDVYPMSDATYNCGLSNKKYLSFNGINPGALFLPDLNNGIDISGYISYGADRYDSTYTVPADGYITIYGTGGGTASGIVITNGNCAQSSYSVRRSDLVWYVGVTLPVSAGDVVTIGTNNVTSLINAKFYPCQGNV